MTDVRVVEVAGRQFNRVSRAQLHALGVNDLGIARRVAATRLVPVHQAVFAIPPVLAHDPWGRRMGATLTEPETVLSHESAAAAYGFWSARHLVERVTRPGSGGPRLLDGLVVFRSERLMDDCSTLHGVPITSVERTLLDLAARSRPNRSAGLLPAVSAKALARAAREAIRLELTTIVAIAGYLIANTGRRGVRRLWTILARYSGLPLHRARSGAEVRALEIIRDAGRWIPPLNATVAGQEADLCWPAHRLIVEIDGDPFHQDVGEDARKQAVWEAAGFTVLRIGSDVVYEDATRLLALIPITERP